MTTGETSGDRWQPPRLRLFEGTSRHATWTELFYDLVFVVAIAELAGILADHVDARHLLIYGGLFVPVWWAWAGSVFYANRFDTDDVSHRLLAGAQMLAVAGMAASVGHIEERSTLFALCYVAVRAMLVLAYARVRRHVPVARPLVDRYIIGFALASTIWLASLAVDTPARYVLWAVGMVVDLGTPLFARRHQSALPPQGQHLPERFGLFVVIVLGEAVAAIVVGLRDHAGPGSLLVAAAGMAATVCVWWLYFDHPDESVVLRTRFAGQVWVYSHLPFALAVAAFGVGVEHILAHPGVSIGEGWLAPVAASAVFAVLGLQRACTRERAAVGARFLAAAAMAGTTVPLWLAFPDWTATAPLLVVTTLGVLQVGQSLRPIPDPDNVRRSP